MDLSGIRFLGINFIKSEDITPSREKRNTLFHYQQLPLSGSFIFLILILLFTSSIWRPLFDGEMGVLINFIVAVQYLLILCKYSILITKPSSNIYTLFVQPQEKSIQCVVDLLLGSSIVHNRDTFRM